MQNLQSEIWLDDVHIAENDEHHWFWEYTPAQFDPHGWVFLAAAHPRNWHAFSDTKYGGAVEVTRVYWIRKGDDVQGSGDEQLNIHIKNLGGQCFYSLWVASIDPH
jgi:hypothetical protein